jgi:hypothetical protein
MAKMGYFNAVLSNAGAPITATVTVYEAGTATKATIYSDPGGTILKDNPFQTDVLGRFQFFASVGQYDVEISGSGITTYKIQYINVSDITKSTQLTDMPQSLSGEAKKQLKVMNDETGFELFEPAEIDVRNYASFSAAIDAIGSSEKTLVIPNEQSVTADKAVPSNVALRFTRGGSLNISTAVTVTINGHLAAGLHKIFTCAGTGKVVFGAASIPEIYPEWWGIDGTADDVQIQQAIEAAWNVYVVCLQNKPYYLNAGLTMSRDFTSLRCRGGEANLITSQDIDGITISATVFMENVLIQKTGGASTKYGIKFTDGAHYCNFNNVAAYYFKYNFGFVSSTTGGVVWNDFRHLQGYGAVTAEIYMSTSGSGFVNENKFWGGSLYPGSGGISIITAIASNENKFVGTAFGGGNPYDFTVKEYGLNVFDECRWEGAGFGIWIDNGVSQWDYLTRLNCNFWLCPKPFIVINSGRARVHDSGHTGKMAADTSGSSTVDADSASGQKVLNVAATTNFNVGDSVLINSGGAREEWNEIASIQAGVSLTLQNNLRYTHLATDADAVAGKGLGCSPGRTAKSQIQASPGVVIKADTGDPAYSYDGMICINTYDNNIKMYGDSGWRQLVTW